MGDFALHVFKFGGASVKDADSIRNMASIIISQKEKNKGLLIVVSAMAKTTNALEELLEAADEGRPTAPLLQTITELHLGTAKDLLTDTSLEEAVQNLHGLLGQLAASLTDRRKGETADARYDRVISFGERLSTALIHQYLKTLDNGCHLLDARRYLRTDRTWRDAKLDWAFTKSLIQRDVPKYLSDGLVLTQGFIGSTVEGDTTTLGREGSDFTAAVFASCLDAADVTIWKDVPGVLNADPKLIADARLFDQLSYNDAAEMTFYGASVIHPRTIKPLANKDIPLLVRSFRHPEEPGTRICGTCPDQYIPTIIFKENQTLVSFSVRDLTFINERNLSVIFAALAELNLKINLMQRSAVTFSISMDSNKIKLEKLIITLKDQFTVSYNLGLRLVTVKNYDSNTIDKVLESRKVLLEQRSRETVQYLMAEG